MQQLFIADPFAARRPRFLANTLFLIAVMLLYPVVGGLLFLLVSGGSQEPLSLLSLDKSLLPSIRVIQAVGQIFLLALPVIVLAVWHSRYDHASFSGALAFLGIGKRVDIGTAALAVWGIFLLQPLLYTITAFQDYALWPALGSAGQEVVRQRDVMESFIRELALVRSVPEFFSVAFVFALTPAICEELLFRGYIQQNYTRSMSSGAAVLLTGSIFAFFHLSAANLLPLALLGWYIGYIYAGTGNLAMPFVVHLANNMAALILLFFTDGKNSEGAIESTAVLGSPWWWLVVAGSLWLFFMVLRRLAAAQGRTSHGS
ncbi:MAG: CPBP family intramembrane metalloprotease [Chlorobium sp.]|nr:CPBP family intramembrane metalloprotease [Chlorobium sp.]